MVTRRFVALLFKAVIAPPWVKTTLLFESRPRTLEVVAVVPCTSPVKFMPEEADNLDKDKVSVLELKVKVESPSNCISPDTDL